MNEYRDPDETADLRLKVLRNSTFLLVMRGSHFFAQSRPRVLMQYVLLVWFIITSAMYACESLKFWKSDGLAFTSIGLTTVVAASVTVNAVLMTRQKAIESLLLRLVQRLESHQLRALLKQMNRINILAMIAFLVQPFLWINIIVRRPFNIWLLVSLVARLNLHFAIATSFVYYIFVQTLLLHHRNLIRDCYQDPRTHVIVRAAKSILELSHKFEQLFNVLPFLWFVYGILGAPVTFATLRPSLTLHFVLLFSQIAFTFVSPVLVVIAVDRLRASLSRETDDLRDWVLDRTRDPGAEELHMIYNLESVKRIRFTGISAFTLDRSFVLTYIGTIATFAALISSYVNNIVFSQIKG